MKIESAVIKIQCFIKARKCRKVFKIMLRNHRRKLKMKQFPYDFNESDFIIRNFSKLSRQRRIANSEDRFSGSETTEASGNLSDANHPSNSDGNLSDSCNESNSSSPGKHINLNEDLKDYDPSRDCDDSLRGRTKQKVYVKFSQQKLRKYSVDSSDSEESDDDDPIREMLKTKILNIYEDNNEQLYNNACQWNELKQYQEFKNKSYAFNQDLGQNYGNSFPHDMFAYMFQFMSQMGGAPQTDPSYQGVPQHDPSYQGMPQNNPGYQGMPHPGYMQYAPPQQQPRQNQYGQYDLNNNFW